MHLQYVIMSLYCMSLAFSDPTGSVWSPPAHKQSRCSLGALGGAARALEVCARDVGRIPPVPHPSPCPGAWQGWRSPEPRRKGMRKERSVRLFGHGSFFWQRREDKASPSQPVTLLFFCQRRSEQSPAALPRDIAAVAGIWQRSLFSDRSLTVVCSAPFWVYSP